MWSSVLKKLELVVNNVAGAGAAEAANFAPVWHVLNVALPCCK
jgi:hypothetical protein